MKLKARSLAWWAATVAVLLPLLPCAVLAQGTGQVTQLTITAPDPTKFTQQNPFLTSSDIFPIGFQHNGASHSYFISADSSNTSDVPGSTFLPQPTDQKGTVLIGFRGDGFRTVSLTLLQTGFNVVATSQVPANIFFVKTPPNVAPTTVTLGPPPAPGAPAATTIQISVPAFDPTNPQAPRPATPNIFINNQPGVALQFTIAGTVSDTAMAGDLKDVKIVASGIPGGAAPAAATVQPSGQFTLPITFPASAPDGTYTIQITGQDKMSDATDLGNTSGPILLTVVKDTVPPTVQLLQIIRFPGQANAVTLPAGATTFVGNETINLKVTMSKPMATAPQMTVTQHAGTELPASLLTAPGAPTTAQTVFTYSYQPIPIEAQNGPAEVKIKGQAATATSPAFGTDLAGNPIAATDPSADVKTAFLVDTVPPDLLRLAKGENPQDQSTPANGEVDNDVTFPSVITVHVVDYNNSTGTATDQASGVDFSKIGQVAASASPTAPASSPINIDLKGPNGEIPGLLGALPPNGLTLTIGDFHRLNNPNFVRSAADGVLRPVEGTYTITVSLVDKVGNTSTKTIVFTVRTTPPAEANLRVTLSSNGPTPIPRNGTCIKGPSTPGTVIASFPTITIASSESTFAASTTRVEVTAFFNGNDSQGYAAITTTSLVGKTLNVNVLGIENVNPEGVNLTAPQGGTGRPPGSIPDGQFDPRVALFDGPWTIRIHPADSVGNVGAITTDGRRVDFLDYNVNLDTLDPYTARTFPADGTAINGALRFVDATVVDPAARRSPLAEIGGQYSNPTFVAADRAVPGCGIDIQSTNMALQLITAYQPTNLDPTLITAAPGIINGTLRFIHQPNSLDPTLPGFSPADDRFKVLLEITDKNENARSLPSNGSMDGIYGIAVAPVDKAGNQIITPNSVLQAPTPRPGVYFGLQSLGTTSIATQNLANFYFLFDNAAPKLEVSNFPDGVILANLAFHQGPSTVATRQGWSTTSHAASTPQAPRDIPAGPSFSTQKFAISGFVSDLSSQQNAAGGANANHQGGSGIDHVEYELELVDNQFQLVPQSPVSVDPKGNITTATINPIIPIRRAVLTPPAGTASTDPSPTLTNPWTGGATNFQTLVRPRHAFTINDVLPPVSQIPLPRQNQGQAGFQDFYLFIIRAVDRAGNITELDRRVQLTPSALVPPVLQSPPNNAFLNSPAVLFQWAPATVATSYVVDITRPDTSHVIRGTKGTREQLTLSDEGVYHWTVASVDGVGNVGSPSSPFTFTIDRTPPTVQGLTVTNVEEPSGRAGVISLGDFEMQVTYSEPIDATQAPGVAFTPVGLPPIQLTTESISGNIWQGRGNIPTNAKPAVWDGIASIQVSNVFDLAGNPLIAQPTQTFEINTGPFYDTRFFFNPLNPSEITMLIVSTVNLKYPPSVTNLSGAQQSSVQVYPVARSPRAYYTSLTLNKSSSTSSQVSLQISGEDLNGNSSSRNVSFTVAAVGSSHPVSLASVDGHLKLAVPAAATSKASNLYVFPPSTADDQVVSAAGALIAGRGAADALPASLSVAPPPSTPPGSGMVVVGPLYDLAPHGLSLAKPAQLDVDVGPVPLPKGVDVHQVGVYSQTAGGLTFVAAVINGHASGSLGVVGPLVIAADTKPPVVTLAVADGDALDSSRPTFQGNVSDDGSGVDRTGVTAQIDGVTAPLVFDPATGAVSITPDKDLTPGHHAVSLFARDRAGNVAQSRHADVTAPSGMGASEVIAWPNPTSSFSHIRVRLTQPAVTTSIAADIYNVAGRRVGHIDQEGPFGPGAQDLFWDLTDTQGAMVANGIYIYRVTIVGAGTSVRTHGKIAVMR